MTTTSTFLIYPKEQHLSEYFSGRPSSNMICFVASFAALLIYNLGCYKYELLQRTVYEIPHESQTYESASISCWIIHFHDDVIKWKHFPLYWPFVRGIHRSPVNSPHKGLWRRTLMFSLICTWTIGWVSNRDAIWAATALIMTSL